VKKVAVAVVLFFNTNLLPSPFALQAFYATMNKKEGAAIIAFFSLLQNKEEEGDGNLAGVAFFAALQRNSTRGRRRRR
jgi:hypothetical protein